MDTLVLPVSILRILLRRILDAPDVSLFITTGLRVAAGRRDWLARAVMTSRPVHLEHVFEVRAADVPAGLPLPLTGEIDSSVSGVLLLGTGNSRGRISMLATRAGGVAPFQEVSLVGPGMHRIDLSSSGSRQIAAAMTTTPVSSHDLERWSRTIGAVGGEDVWRRLADLKMTIVGVGRSGSLVARALAAVGVRSLTLIDPDVVERHNLGESDGLRLHDIGVAKATAVARQLGDEFFASDSVVNAIHGSVWGDRGIDVVKQSDVIFSCVDRDAPRLAAALIAAAHHRVIVDIGTAVFREDGAGAQTAERRIRTGADVRVILPGEGCLLCRGGLTDYDGAVRELTGAGVRIAESTDAGVFGRRPGSLRSLNMMAVGAALRLFEGVIAGHGHGGWMHLEDDGTGRYEVRYLDARDRLADCPLCQRAGMGD